MRRSNAGQKPVKRRSQRRSNTGQTPVNGQAQVKHGSSNPLRGVSRVRACARQRWPNTGQALVKLPWTRAA